MNEMMKISWIYLLLGGLTETIWAVSMKYSNGFTIIPYAVVTVVFIIISTFLLAKAMEGGIPMGTAYAVWVGIGAVGAVLCGIILLGDPVGMLQMLFLALIIAGIVGLQMTSGKKDESTQT